MPAAASTAAAGSRSVGGAMVEVGEHALEQPGVLLAGADVLARPAAPG